MTTLDKSTFEHINPTDTQKRTMATVRMSAALFAGVLEGALPDGPDKTYVLRKLRELAMWANTAITRLADGSPRPDLEDEDGDQG